MTKCFTKETRCKTSHDSSTLTTTFGIVIRIIRISIGK